MSYYIPHATYEMIIYYHKLSGLLFYLFGSSFFIAYLLHFNNIEKPLARWWLDVADLPLAFVAMLYGGLSLYRSIAHPERGSPVAGG